MDIIVLPAALAAGFIGGLLAPCLRSSDFGPSRWRRRPAPRGEKVFVRKGTPAWEAWASHFGRHPDRMTSLHSHWHAGTGWYFDSPFPPESPR